MPHYCGNAPFLECSTAGDKRFSSFCARVKVLGNKSIEELYQGAKVFEDGSTGLHWKQAKGRRAVNDSIVRVYFDTLWILYIAENVELIFDLIRADGLSDKFGSANAACSATSLWMIRCHIIKLYTADL